MVKRTKNLYMAGGWPWTCAAALLAFCIVPSSGMADITVEFLDTGCGITQHRPDSEMENPSRVDGRNVLEFRDSDSGGSPDWIPTGTVDGSVNQAWLRDSGAEINTTTTVPGKVVFVHLQGDSNDGRGEIEIDSVLKARLDMNDSPGTNNVRLVCDGLSNTTHTIRVNDIDTGGGDIAVWGGGVLGPVSIPALSSGGIVLLGAGLLLATVIGATLSRSRRTS